VVDGERRVMKKLVAISASEEGSMNEKADDSADQQSRWKSNGESQSDD
jgi:hypothetical protein